VEALGYPGVASFESGTAEHSTVTATFSSGQVTNRLQTPGGFAAIEDSATINHGSSGGPLLNARGQVIGMVTAGDASIDTATETNGGKFFYAIPVSCGTTCTWPASPSTSPQQATWDRAMALMQQSQYQAALTDLRHVQAAGHSTPCHDAHPMIKAAIGTAIEAAAPPQPGHGCAALAGSHLTGTACATPCFPAAARRSQPETLSALSSNSAIWSLHQP
jgi:hypothetical protein